MKYTYLAALFFILCFSCKSPLVRLNYSDLVNSHAKSNADTTLISCKHIYQVKYPYCNFLKESENIIDFGLQLNDSLCVETAKEFQYLSLIELFSGDDHNKIRKVLLVSFIYSNLTTQSDGVSNNPSNVNSNVFIKGSAIIYSGIYIDKEKTELLLEQKYTYQSKKIDRSVNTLKKRQNVNLLLKLKKEANTIHCQQIINHSNNRLSGKKPLVIEVSKTLGIDAISFEEIHLQCEYMGEHK